MKMRLQKEFETGKETYMVGMKPSNFQAKIMILIAQRWRSVQQENSPFPFQHG